MRKRAPAAFALKLPLLAHGSFNARLPGRKGSHPAWEIELFQVGYQDCCPGPCNSRSPTLFFRECPVRIGRKPASCRKGHVGYPAGVRERSILLGMGAATPHHEVRRKMNAPEGAPIAAMASQFKFGLLQIVHDTIPERLWERRRNEYLQFKRARRPAEAPATDFFARASHFGNKSVS